MNKSELIDAVAHDTGSTKVAAAAAVDAVVANIVKAVASGDSVALIGFGTFEAVDKAAREGRNPATGEVMKIAAKRVPRFKPGATFKTEVAAKTAKKVNVKK